MNTVNLHATNTHSERPKTDEPPLSKISGHYRKQSRQLRRQKKNLKAIRIIVETQTLAQTTLYPIKSTTTLIGAKTKTEQMESKKMIAHHVGHVKKQANRQRNATLEPIQPVDRLPRTGDRKDRTRSSKREPKQFKRKCSNFGPNITP